MRLCVYKDLSLQITHPAQERLVTPPGSASPVDESLSEKTQIHFKSCVFAPLPTHNKIICNDESVNSRMKFPYKTYSAIHIALLRLALYSKFAFNFYGLDNWELRFCNSSPILVLAQYENRFLFLDFLIYIFFKQLASNMNPKALEL